jgi:hypothetical protein
MIEALKARVNDDRALVRRGRYLTTTFLLEVGQTPWLISIFEGRIASVTRGPFVIAVVVLRAPRPGRGVDKILEPSAAAVQRLVASPIAVIPGRRKSVGQRERGSRRHAWQAEKVSSALASNIPAKGCCLTTSAMRLAEKRGHRQGSRYRRLHGYCLHPLQRRWLSSPDASRP